MVPGELHDCIRINFRTRQHVSIQVHVLSCNKDTILYSSWGDIGRGQQQFPVLAVKFTCAQPAHVLKQRHT